MTGYYNLLNALKVHLTADPIVNTVTQGDIFKVDLNKQTIFPLAHIIVNSVTFEDNIQRVNVSVLCMDVVDISKQATTDIFEGNDNELDVLHTQ